MAGDLRRTRPAAAQRSAHLQLEDGRRGLLAQERSPASSDGWVAPGRRAELAERLAPPTFGEYARQWLADRSLKPRTREGYQHLLRRYLEPDFGKLLVSELTPALVRRWWAGPSPEHPTVNARAYALLRAILSTAVTEIAAKLSDLARPPRA